MNRPLLGVFAGKAHVLVEVEAADPAGVEPPPVGRLREELVEPRRGVSRGQSERHLLFAAERSGDLPDDNVRSDPAHVVEVVRHQYGDAHGLPLSEAAQPSSLFTTSAI